mmetsp:Transcript_36947/g.80765  ORF Transcript_36947/g.80765 Transcript_36947/m.80765 type:complete len:209 (-) Transcript_36947:516-1142(-)
MLNAVLSSLHQAIRLGLSTTCLLLQDLDRSIEGVALTLSLCQAGLKLRRCLLASIVQVVQGCRVFGQFLLCDCQVTLGGRLDFLLFGQSLASGFQLLVVKRNLIGQRLLDFVVLELRSHLSLVSVGLLTLSLVKHVTQDVQNGTGAVVCLVRSRRWRLASLELCILLGLHQRCQTLLVVGAEHSSIHDGGKAVRQLLHLRGGDRLHQA